MPPGTDSATSSSAASSRGVAATPIQRSASMPPGTDPAASSTAAQRQGTAAFPAAAPVQRSATMPTGGYPATASTYNPSQGTAASPTTTPIQRSATAPRAATPIRRATTASPTASPTTSPTAALALIQRSAPLSPITAPVQRSAIAAEAQTPTHPRAQRAVPIHRPAPASSAPLPLPMAFRAPAAPPLMPPIQRAGGVSSFVADAARAQARDTRQRFNDTVDDQVGSFTDKIADLRDAAALVRDPSQFKDVVKQRGLDLFAEHNPIAGTLLGYRRSEPEYGSGGGCGGSSRGRGRGEHQEMEMLAEKLVAPLARLLRTELRMDRERMGRLRDSGR
ncbi:hypothetical protein ABIA31_000575 [Catenulispora sp. MAP5-51]|uniref:hypothetical protein n=1 Tax=Catenulispora sp. MAP5-51 TaxID=3156298 RepID=UPI003512B0AB